jgi:hypothetical protein
MPLSADQTSSVFTASAYRLVALREEQNFFGPPVRTPALRMWQDPGLPLYPVLTWRSAELFIYAPDCGKLDLSATTSASQGGA